MLGDDITFGSPEEKLRNYEAFNDPSNMFTKPVNLDDFTASNRDSMESQIQGIHADKEDELLRKAISRNETLLSKVGAIPTMQRPTPTKDNPFPHLAKPMIDLGAYDKDKHAQTIIKEIDGLGYTSEDKQYLKVLGARESSFRNVDNKNTSYKGMYQFNKGALAAVGISMDDYKKDTKLQYEAAIRYRDNNLKQLKEYTQYIGTIKDGVTITKNGLGAMAHLLGAGTVRDFFDGTKKTKLAQNGFKDGNGTHITEYLKMFS